MPKCVISGCEQTAFYGQQFNNPLYCKGHMPKSSGSVKKKCVEDGCANAAFSGDFCPRCLSVHTAIHEFKMMRLEELKSIIEKEKNIHISQQLSQSTQSVKKVSVPTLEPQSVRQLKPTLPPRHPSDTSLSRPLNPGIPSKMEKSAVLKSVPKIVRTPDEPLKTNSHMDDVSLLQRIPAKKRSQTPGRPKALTSVPEVKN